MGSDTETLKSTSGYRSHQCTKGILSGKSTQQPTCAQSKVKAEDIACAHVVSQLEWMQGLLAEIGFKSLGGESSFMCCQMVDKSHSAYFDVLPPK